MNRISLMLEYFHPWPNSAGFYLARERGWYEAAGLELEIRVFDPARGDTLAHLLRGEVQFGVFPSNRLLVRRERREPLIGIAAINHGGLETIQTVRQTGITRPRDLEGRRIAMGPTPRGIAMVKHLIANDGGNPRRPSSSTIAAANSRSMTSPQANSMRPSAGIGRGTRSSEPCPIPNASPGASMTSARRQCATGR